MSNVGVDVSIKLTPIRLSELRVEKINDEPSSSVPVKTSSPLRVKGEEMSLIALPLSKKSPPEMLTVLLPKLLKERKPFPNVPPEMSTVLPLEALKSFPNVPPEMLTVLPLLAPKFSPTEPPEMLTVLPPNARKTLPTFPPEILTVLSLKAIKESPNVPPEISTVLPLRASKLVPMVPPEMLTVLPLLALKLLPTVPPEMLTSTLVLGTNSEPALKKSPTEPPPETFSWVLERIPIGLEKELSIESPENSLGFGLPRFSGRLMTVSNCA